MIKLHGDTWIDNINNLEQFMLCQQSQDIFDLIRNNILYYKTERACTYCFKSGYDIIIDIFEQKKLL